MNHISPVLEMLKQGVRLHPKHNYKLRGWRLVVFKCWKTVFDLFFILLIPAIVWLILT